jgi:hypothetical protein
MRKEHNDLPKHDLLLPLRPRKNRNVMFSCMFPMERDTTVILENCYVEKQDKTFIHIEHQGEKFVIPRKKIVNPNPFTTKNRHANIEVDEKYARNCDPPLI